MSQADAYLEARLHRRRRVEDVMTTVVVTVDRLTPYKEIVCLLAEHRISSLPVLADGWQVVGVVSETELLAAWSRRVARIAGELMIAPVTIRPDATISAATRVMTAHDATSLPVTGATVRHGVVTLSGTVRAGRQHDLLPLALRTIWDIDGVVDVVNRATGGEGPHGTGKSAPG